MLINAALALPIFALSSISMHIRSAFILLLLSIAVTDCSFLDKFYQAGEAVLKKAGEVVSESSIGQAVGEALSAIGEQANSTFYEVKESNVGKTVGEAAVAIAEQAVETGKAIKDSRIGVAVVDTASDAIDGVKDSKVGKTVVKAAVTIANETVNAAEAINNAEISEKIGDMLVSGSEAIASEKQEKKE